MSNSRRKRLSLAKQKVKEASAARAVYQSGEEALPKIELTLKTDEAEYLFELTLDETHKLIEQLSVSYEAVIKPLRK